MPRPMTDQHVLDFIMEAPRTGQLATVRDDGRPHVATLWLTVDNGDIVFVTSSESVKARNLRRCGYAALAVDDGNPPFSQVTIEGPVELSTNMPDVRHWACRIAARYMGEAWARAFTEMPNFPDDLLCRLTPRRLSGLADLAAS